MRSELLDQHRESDPAGAAEAPRVAAAFDPYLLHPGRPSPGARHAAWTLGATIAGPVRDRMALAGGPAGVLQLGADQGWLALQLLGWGCRPVRVHDSDSERLQRLERLADALAITDPALEPAGPLPAPPTDDAEPAPEWEIALLDARPGMVGAEPAALALAAALARCAIVISADRGADRTRLRSVGFDRVALVDPPADAERRFIRFERAVLVAERAEPR